MVGLKPGRLFKPKMGNLGEHLAFARDAVGHNAIKGGYSVRSDKQQAVAKVKDLAHFAALHFFEAGQIQIQQGFVCHGRKYGLVVQKVKAEIKIPPGLLFGDHRRPVGCVVLSLHGGFGNRP